MTAVADAFEAAAEQDRAALVGYLPAGFPSVAGALDVGRELGPDGLIVVNLSGRGDKDVDTASQWFGV